MFKKILLTIMVAALLLPGMNLANGQNQRFSLEETVPAQTLLFTSFPNLTQALQAFDKTGLGGLVKEQELQAFVAALLTPYEGQIADGIKQAEKQLGIPLFELTGMLHGEVALAVVEVIPQDRQMPLGILLSLQFGPNRKVIDDILQIVQAKTGLVFQPVARGDRQIFVANGIPICFTIVQDTIVFSSKPELLEKTLTQSADTALLCKAPSFVKAKEKVQKNATPFFLFYLNLNQLLLQFGNMIPPQVAPMITTLGLFDIQSLALGINMQDQYFYNAFFMEIKGEPRGVTKLLYGDPCSRSYFKEIPQNVMGASVFRVNLTSIFDEIELTLRALGLEPMYQQFSQQLEQVLGFSIQKDFAGTFGPESFSFQYFPQDGGLLPYTVGMLTIKDMAAFGRWVEPFAKQLNLEIKKTNYNGHEIHYFSSLLGELGTDPFKKLERKGEMGAFFGALGYGFSGMSFFIENNRLYTGNSMHDLKNFLDNRGNWNAALADAPDFQKMAPYIPQNSSFVVYQDFRQLLSGLWNTTVPVLKAFEGFMRGAGIPFDTALLPQAKTLTRHLLPSVTAYVSDEDGIWLQSYSATGGVIVLPLVAGIGIGAAVAIPGLLKARMEGNESSAIGTLRTLSVSQAQFQSQAYVDQDKDGTGEYGFIQELAGTVAVRGKTEPISEPLVSSGRMVADGNGVFLRSGYCFYCYLPGVEKAIGEAEGVGIESGTDVADAQEQRFVIYAWPVTPNETGRRAFVVNQSGQIYTNWSFTYNRNEKPNPEDAFSRESPNAYNLEGEISGDANQGYWMPLD